MSIQDMDWPWCDNCRSYHHPKNPTCRRPFARWAAAFNLDWHVWVLLAVAFWVLADVAPNYHGDEAHGLYTLVGGVAFVAALRKLVIDVKGDR